MEADFSGWATKAGLKCSDGRTIMSGAFKHQDKARVPLVWQHGHSDPQNVLGHAILENRGDEGVYAYCFFNDSDKAKHARELVEHEDINMMSIWANDLIERAKQVLHGAIREVSLVISGANPGAVIENVTLRHSDGDETELDDEVIIFTGLPLEHSEEEPPGQGEETEQGEEEEETSEEGEEEELTEEEVATHIKDVYETMDEEQQEVLHYMIGEALENKEFISHKSDGDATVKEIYESMTEAQKKVLHFMVGEALESAGEAQHSNLDDSNLKGTEMGNHNVFEQGAEETPTLSHADIEGIVADATRNGSLKNAVEQYALSHGIDNIDVLFPDAKAITSTPEWFARRNEWVNKVLGETKKSPFSRIKTMFADITMEEARAKGYVTGTLKKEEFFSVAKRVTTPTTVYKKQSLDRDDMIDITDFDVVAWLKGEMRIMLDEEIARAILLSDGRDIAHEDKINEQNIRPIVKDHELYTITINVNIDDADSSVQEIVDAVVLNRSKYRGSGMPTFFTTETYIAQFLLLKDSLGRRIYKSLDEVASDLRVKEIVPVEPMEEYDDIVGVLVNMTDYVTGADAGGNVSMFDDFDIDYNKHKYLIETRLSGALTRLKSAMVVKKVPGTDELVIPNEPAFDGDAITITDQTGVIYQDASDDSVMNAAGSPYAVADGETFTVNAVPDTGYYFPSTEDDSWTFTGV